VSTLFLHPLYRNALITCCALGVACGLLSVLVVLRRWAFIGEGISHSGFGGVGTAWLLSLAIPALGSPGAAYAVAVVFCLVMALVIGWVSRRERVNADAAIGIVLVGSLAWGGLALQIYEGRGRPHGPASGWDFALLGASVQNLSPAVMAAGVCVAAAVVITLAALAKEILVYCMDPELAEVSGVRAGFVHYLLMLLLALVIVMGMQLTGALLITALLVLPGATALLLSRRLATVLALAVTVNLVAVLCGLALRAAHAYVPFGPALVLALIAQFVLAYAWSLVAGRRRTA
jgi:ABC-type Mn2+/Zn2+ transport system permease subunit